ncbi:hypothetical protein HMPREF0762_01485 [Slackia exigua ATCC 700122]|uniref:Uncharacterized protein n=1 Tax=Slackia exigua (strain ATCC 700122 / DSM 15923 / CIP 105133 / JCM 11022 / KCTC 5966 / S-7) TaxID=649764 RepID=D0WI12_SLAES|nr:hypothetical protein HMPREF0762_01485 [Slackia exigua ATCC 700122]
MYIPPTTFIPETIPSPSRDAPEDRAHVSLPHHPRWGLLCGTRRENRSPTMGYFAG